jgi:hypothetical protein
VAQAVRVGDGTPSGSYRLFDFRIKEGTQYSAVLVGDGGTLTLFDATTLSVVVSESDNDGLQHVTTPSWQDETA